MNRILCIEDEANFRDSISEWLTDNGYDVTQACDGMEALELIETEPKFNLILCDIWMPRLNGYKVLESLRSHHPHYAMTPFIFLTALGHKDDIMKAHHLGCDEYLSKPVDFDLLLLMVQSRIHRVQTIEARIGDSNTAFQDTLIKIFSNEMMEPTNGIVSLVAFISESLSRYSDADLDSRLKMLYHYASQQMSMLQQVLTLLGSDGNDPLSIADYPCQLSDLKAHIERLIDSSGQKHSVQFHCDDSARLLCDSFILSRALANFLSHSIRQQSEIAAPIIRMSLEGPHRQLECWLADNATVLEQLDEVQHVVVKDRIDILNAFNHLSMRMIPMLYLFYIAKAHDASMELYYGAKGAVACRLFFPARRTIKFQLAM